MEKIKKSLFMIATGLVASTAFTVVATSHNAIFENTFAGGTVINDKERTTTFDSETSVVVDGSARTFTEGNLGLYVSNSSQLENGLFTLESGNAYVYCPTAGVNANNKQYGFSGSTISSISIVVNNRNVYGAKLTMGWAQLDSELAKTSGPSSTWNYNLAQSSNNQTITTESTDNVITGQHSGYNCLCIFWSKTAPLDVVSLTINYSCTIS